MASFNRKELDKQIADLTNTEIWNTDLEVEIQTDKEVVKLVPCRECKRPLVVTTFFAPAKAVCSACKGDTDGTVASVGQPVPGQTEPAKAVDLTKVLVNQHFAQALCPVHPDDEEHVMELKSVTHNNNYGPSEFIGYSNGRPQYRQIAIGESVLHQCLKCKATVSYSTMLQSQLKRVNEKRERDDRPKALEMLLGAREETG